MQTSKLLVVIAIAGAALVATLLVLRHISLGGSGVPVVDAPPNHTMTQSLTGRSHSVPTVRSSTDSEALESASATASVDSPEMSGAAAKDRGDSNQSPSAGIPAAEVGIDTQPSKQFVQQHSTQADAPAISSLVDAEAQDAALSRTEPGTASASANSQPSASNPSTRASKTEAVASNAQGPSSSSEGRAPGAQELNGDSTNAVTQHARPGENRRAKPEDLKPTHSPRTSSTKITLSPNAGRPFDATAAWSMEVATAGPTLSLVYAGEAAFDHAVVLVFSKDMTADAGKYIQVLDSKGTPTSGNWEVSPKNQRMLILKVLSGRYVLILSDSLVDAAGETLGARLHGPVYVH